MNIKHKIQQSFNRAADSYDESCHAQLRAGIKLAHMIKSCHAQAGRIIDLGCGTGLTTQIMASQYCYRDFHAIDISTLLLMKAYQRLNKLNIHVHEMDFENITIDFLKLDAGFDIVYSNMALHWSSDIFSTLVKLHKIINTNGSLAFSLPLTGTFKELKPHYTINPFPDINIIHHYLASAGFTILMSESENIRLTFPHAIQALKSIKQTGANCTHHSTHKGLHGKSYLNHANFNELTYELGYFLARKSDKCD